MTKMMTIKDAAALWNISERRVNELCKNGRIKGAVKKDNRWQILQEQLDINKRWKGIAKIY